MSYRPIIFMFSGQGSHYYQMGRELFERNACFKQHMLFGEEIFKAQIGLSLLQELYAEQHRKADIFDRTLATHPAIITVQYAMAQTLIADGIKPDLVLGTSLGEFTAAILAGYIDFETALRAVITQAQCLEQHCLPGGMLAILHSPEFYYDTPQLHQVSELASHNFKQHFVVSAPQQNLASMEALLKKQQISYQRLAVSHAFHSRWIDPAASHYLTVTQSITINKPRLPLISCQVATAINKLTFEHFWEAVRKPILFQKTIQTLEKQSAYTYIDVGTAGTLATFVKYNLEPSSQSYTLPTLTPYGNDLDNLFKMKGALNP